MIFIVMGVSGCGKSTVGRALAKKISGTFYDGDDFHPAANVEKMANGRPLNDTDREPWLKRLAQLATDSLAKRETAVIACSALKQKYRDLLRADERVQFVYLQGDFDLIWKRISKRKGHFMKPKMLESQFATLEEPSHDEALHASVADSVDDIVSQIVQQLGQSHKVL